MRINFIIFILLLVALELGVSFYMRINFWPLYQHFGFYQGDIWYFLNFYGESIKHNFFFQIEYPVGYVIIQKTAFFISRILFQNVTYEAFMLTHALFIIPAALMIIIAVHKICLLTKTNSKIALLLLTISPSMLIYSTINYDIFTVALTFLAIFMILKQKYFLSFLLLGLGATIKIYPAFLIPIFIFFLLARKIRLLKIVISFFIAVLTFISLNLPFLLYNLDYWIFPYKYQTTINPGRNDPTTLAYYLSTMLNNRSLQNFLLPAILLLAWFFSYLFYKKSQLTDKNFVLLCFLTCFSAVFGNYIYSPQYILWFLPFVALFQFPPIEFWLPFDFLNTAHIFFFFKIKNDFPHILHSVWNMTVLFYLGLYILFYGRLLRALFYEKQKN